MALYENNIQLKGFLGKDASTKTTRQQRGFTVLSLATKSSYKDKQTGEWVSHTDWHRVVVFGKTDDSAKSLKKGDYVEIEGELRSSQYDSEGAEGQGKQHRVWEIRATKINRLERPVNPDTEEAVPA